MSMVFPFEASIEKASDFYVNADEVLAVLSEDVTMFWSRESNGETCFKNAEGRTLYSATTTIIFMGPKRKDWKQVITHVYGATAFVNRKISQYSIYFSSALQLFNRISPLK